MKNVHLIPTDKPSRLIKNNLGYAICPNDFTISDLALIEAKFVNIYITSDEEIKVGDWYYLPRTNSVYKCNEDPTELNLERRLGVAKIILTTDPDLIGVQAIDNEFLEWFVKNPNCEYVEVQDMSMQYHDEGYYEYKIIIPQEEPKQEWNPTQGEEVWIKVFSNWSKGIYIGYDVTKQTHIVREEEKGGGNLYSSTEVLPYSAMPNEPKQETLEEAAAHHFNTEELVEGVNIQYSMQSAFIEGARWQAERMYSEEEAFNLCRDFAIFVQQNRPSYKKQLEWFEQQKKK